MGAKINDKSKNKNDPKNECEIYAFLEPGVLAADPGFHSKDSYGRYILSKKMYSQRRNLTFKHIQVKSTIRQPFF